MPRAELGAWRTQQRSTEPSRPLVVHVRLGLRAGQWPTLSTTRSTTMNSRHGILAVALGLALAGAATAETIIVAEPEVRTIVTKAGYGEPVLIKRESDLWRVRSLSPAGKEVTLFVNAEGKVLGARDVVRTRLVTTTTTTKVVAPPKPITAAEVNAVLADAGFHNVHDVSLGNGVWKAEADDITGSDFEVHVDAKSGQIVHVEDD